MDIVSPTYGSNAFHCPFCGTYAHMSWGMLKTDNYWPGIRIAKCRKCQADSIWLEGDERMIHPNRTSAPLPAKDMPEEVRTDYEEAADIFGRSPRAAAALLRLALQKLCVHLGEPGKHIDTDIRALAAKNTLPPLLIKIADTVRLTGNNAVHPGEMSAADVDHVASKMFIMINMIVQKGITEPIEMEALYQLTPAEARKKAEEKDAKKGQA